jgi:hypothetical protein
MYTNVITFKLQDFVCPWDIGSNAKEIFPKNSSASFRSRSILFFFLLLFLPSSEMSPYSSSTSLLYAFLFYASRKYVFPRAWLS